MRNFNCITFICLTLAVGCSSSASAGTALSEGEAYVVVERLIALRPVAPNREEALERYRAWGDLYMEYWRRATEGPTEQDLKVYLLLVFASYQSGSTEMLEHVSQTFLPIFEVRSETILRVLANHAFMVNSTCMALRDNFYFVESEQESSKQMAEFLRMYRERIRETLARRDQGQECLATIAGTRHGGSNGL